MHIHKPGRTNHVQESRLLPFLLMLALIGLASPSQAQAVCSDRLAQLKHLADKYKEAPVAMGLANSGSVLEVLAAEDGETWTMLLTNPSGKTCAIASGFSWMTIEVLRGEGT